MAAWITANLGTIIVSAIIVLVVALVIFVMIRDRRSGKSSCSCGCSSCAMSGECQKRRDEFLKKKASEDAAKAPVRK